MKPCNLPHKKNDFINIPKSNLPLVFYSMLVLLVLLTGCNATKDLTKGKDPVEVRPQIKAKRTYHVITHSGEELVIRVTRVDSLKVQGFVSYSKSDIKDAPYEETLDKLYQNARKISKDRNDVLYIVGAAGILITVIVVIIKESSVLNIHPL